MTADPRDIDACTRKRRYMTKQNAKLGAARAQRNANCRIYPYQCSVCGHYHVSHMPPEIARQFRRERDP